MSDANLTHWRKFYNPNYLGAYAFKQGEEKILTIREMRREAVKGEGGVERECTVAHFVEKDVKPMIFNVTNCRIMYRIYKTGFFEQWAGKAIQVYVEPEVKVKDGITEGLRIRPKIPTTSKPPLRPEDAKWQKAVERFANGKTSLDWIKNNYQLNAKDEQQLIKEAEQCRAKDS